VTALWLLLAQLAVWQPVRPPVLHQGHWQSCDHAERVLEHRVLGRLVWELHLGPDDEFGLYDHAVDGDHDHGDRANLLAPGFRYEGRMGKAWTVPRLHLWVNVVRGGGSRDECAEHAFYVMVRQQ
jgi:hypothetical protein